MFEEKIVKHFTNILCTSSLNLINFSRFDNNTVSLSKIKLAVSFNALFYLVLMLPCIFADFVVVFSLCG